MRKKVVLITGCSTGFGKAICQALYGEKYFVVATARNLEKLADVPADLRLTLDVFNEESIRSAREEILKCAGKIDVLINNAGFSVRSALEEVDLSVTKQMYEVNVFGMIRMIQSVLPIMRSQKSGKILNIGSISGRMTSYVNGVYCSTKHAVEAITEAVRYEVADMGIEVSVIEPGAMETDFFQTLSRNSDAIMSNPYSPYHAFYERDMAIRKVQKKAPITECAKQVARLLDKKKLKVRYMVAVNDKFRMFLHLPDALKEYLVLK